MYNAPSRSLEIYLTPLNRQLAFIVHMPDSPLMKISPVKRQELAKQRHTRISTVIQLKIKAD
jgi:hypothetical protein